ncbi:hypothetical protein F5B22DRAFT_484864 [Xylaria bambusicola]|uniref:uncharacterized protein n=1 Tax=Xylaria bambusicola TaxID=326684 RepID=UPI002007D037|nr:uncharacterized protein F5B22DRAFT_484864 [Xylaria bambusicola]KAI0505995.1 hypothetical protein F5B22DRAFT_484864 [Xylaria bambusicola]
MTESPRVSRPSPSPGGFLPSQALPSPTPSTASSRVAALLPHPRSKPLVPGSKKEDYARDYVARRLLHISRRYVKKFGIPDPADEVTGYENMEEVCHDLEEVVDVLWFSGTPSLQVPYLLNVALALNTYLPSFPPAPRPTFTLLRKIDHCFASLLVGYDVKTKEPLPGFSSTVDNSNKMRFSKTDMVRCKSLADETRMLVAMVMSGEVDVVDYTEDDEVVQRPARAQTEARNISVNVEDHASHSFHGVEIVKDEEMDGVDDFDFSSEGEGVAVPTKRKAGEISQDDAINDQAAKIKQVKIEDEEEGDSSVKLNDIAPADDSGSRVGRESKSDDNGQFHWALEDDDDDDDDDKDDDDSDNEKQPSRTASTSKTTNLPSRGANLPSPPRAPVLNDAKRTGTNNEEEEKFEEYEDEEDEELELNVGKVYEKTLVRLGETLGESLIDD